MAKYLFAKLLKTMLIGVLSIIAILTIWTLTSLIFVRISVSSESSEPEQLGLRSEVLLEIAVQANRISFDHDGRSSEAALAWVKGTSVFFTNEHVAERMCDEKNVCRFEERDALDFSSKKRELYKKVCLPQRDICVLYATEDKKTIESFEFATAEVGQDVYYVDWDAAEFKIFKGKVLEKKEGALIIKGYGRHGYSGSPIFNDQGRIIGVISEMDGPLWLRLPHFMMFGWVQSNTFKVVADSSSFWMSQDQSQLARSEWMKALNQLTSQSSPPHEACASSWASGKVVFQFVWLVARWRNDFQDQRYIDVIERFPESSDLRETCTNLLEIGRSSLPL